MSARHPSAMLFLACCLALFAHCPVLADDRSEFFRLERQFTQLLGAGRYDEAQKVADRQLALARRSVRDNVPMTHHRVGMCQMHRGKFQEAITNLQASLDAMQGITPRQPGLRAQFQALRGVNHNYLGLCYSNLAHYDDAIRNFESSVVAYEQIRQPENAAITLINLADLRYRRGEFEQAEQDYHKIVTVLEPAAGRERTAATFTGNLATAFNGLGDISERRGQFRQAETHYRRALDLRTRVTGWEHPATATILNNMGIHYGSQGNWEEAEWFWDEASRLQEKFLGAEHPLAARTNFNLGRLALLREELGKAESNFRKALVVIERDRGSQHPETAVVLRDLGSVQGKRGNLVEAVKLLDRSIDTLENTLGAVHPDVAMSLAGRAEVELLRGNHDAVMKLTDRALAIGEQSYLQEAVAALLHQIRAQSLWKAKKRSEATAELKQAIALVEMQRAFSAGAERERAQLLGNYMKKYILMVEWQAALGDLAKTFAAMEAMKTRTFLDELELKNIDLLADLPDDERRRLTEREQELRKKVTSAEQKLFALPASKKDAPDPKLEERLRDAVSDVSRARRQLYQHLAAMRHASPRYQHVISADQEFLPLAELQSKHLGPKELMLAYNISLDAGLILLAIRREDARMYQVVVDDAVAENLAIPAGPLTVGKLNRLLVDEEYGVVPALSDRKAATTKNARLRALWRLLIPAELQAELTDGSLSQLTIIPSGSLALLPFEALIVSDEKESQLRYLLDEGPPIVYAPSATVLAKVAAREPATVKLPEAVLTVGDPAYPQPEKQASGSSPSSGRLPLSAQQRFRAGLARLPYSGEEAKSVEKNFAAGGIKSVRLLEGEATEAAVRRLAPGREILHFACHGIVDTGYANFYGALAFVPGNAGDPRDDGFLSMSEVYDLDLSACQLTILSACQTNYGPRQVGEGVWALSRGFLVAGSRRVVASNWVVSDPAAAQIVPQFVDHLAKSHKQGQPPNYALALQEARRSARNQQKWESPFFWAPFMLVGTNQ